MNPIYRALRVIPLIALSIAAIAACDFSSDSKSKKKSGAGGETSVAALTFTASSAAAPAALQSALQSAALAFPLGMTVTEFWIAVEDIEFARKNEDMADESDVPEYDGPYYINLLDPSGILAETLGEVEIPAGTYLGIEFDIHHAEDAAAPDILAGRSIYLAGTYDDAGTPRDFEIWSDADQEVLMTGPNGITVESGTTGNTLVVDFDLDALLAGVDLSTAVFDPVTGDFTGDYAISPDSTATANKQLADDMKANLEQAGEFGEDADGDGELENAEDTENDGDEDGDGVDDDLENDADEDEDGVLDEDDADDDNDGIADADEVDSDGDGISDDEDTDDDDDGDGDVVDADDDGDGVEDDEEADAVRSPLARVHFEFQGDLRRIG